MQYLTLESDRYLLAVELGGPAEPTRAQPSLTIVDELRQTTVSHWCGPLVLVLLGRSCLPMLDKLLRWLVIAAAWTGGAALYAISWRWAFLPAAIP